MTATHQLKSAVTSVAYAGRSLFLTTLSCSPFKQDDFGGTDSFSDLLMIALSNALLGLDANDPPKTLATMQLIGSLFSNVNVDIYNTCGKMYAFFKCYSAVFHLQMALLEDSTNELSPLPEFQFSEWLDEFLIRLFSLLRHLEPSGVL